MLKEIFTAALGMQNNQTRLEVVANNIANANTSGFKSASVFERNLIDARANFYNTPGDIEQNDSPIGSYYDFGQGVMRETGNPMDLAIEGNGFFLMQDAEGKEFLTRSGSFRLSTDGELIAMDGKKLIGESGPIVIAESELSDPLSTGEKRSVEIRIAPTGEIYANDIEVNRLNIVTVADTQWLQRVSASDFIVTYGGETNLQKANEVIVRQGWLEGSNVNVVEEMVEMIELQRMFEAADKVIRTNDSTIDKSIASGRFF